MFVNMNKWGGEMKKYTRKSNDMQLESTLKETI